MSQAFFSSKETPLPGGDLRTGVSEFLLVPSVTRLPACEEALLCTWESAAFALLQGVLHGHRTSGDGQEATRHGAWSFLGSRKTGGEVEVLFKELTFKRLTLKNWLTVGSSKPEIYRTGQLGVYKRIRVPGLTLRMFRGRSTFLGES